MSELTLDFSGVAYAKMMAMVASTSTEVAWQGIVEKKNDDLYHISDIVIHPQYVSAARVTDADEEYSQWINMADRRSVRAAEIARSFTRELCGVTQRNRYSE